MKHVTVYRILPAFLLAAVFIGVDRHEALALDFRFPLLRSASIPDNAKAEMLEEERISEVLDQDVNYRQLFDSISNPDVQLDRYVQPGEELRFQARWRGLPAGNVRLAAKRLGVIKGRPVLVFELNAESNDFLNAFYPVNTNANSYADVNTGRSYLIRRRISERNRNYKDRLEFKYDFRLPNGLPDPICQYSLVGDSGQEEAAQPVPIPGNMQDMVSAIYYIRGLDLKKPGDSCRILIGGRKQPGIMTLQVVGEERIKVPNFGAFDCLVVEPNGDGTNISSNLIAARGSERFWLEKHTRIPIAFSAELPAPLGTIVATLVSAKNSPVARYAVTP